MTWMILGSWGEHVGLLRHPLIGRRSTSFKGLFISLIKASLKAQKSNNSIDATPNNTKRCSEYLMSAVAWKCGFLRDRDGCIYKDTSIRHAPVSIWSTCYDGILFHEGLSPFYYSMHCLIIKSFNCIFTSPNPDCTGNGSFRNIQTNRCINDHRR